MTAYLDTVASIDFDSYYHIYNRSNDRENVFYSQENYRYFLKRYDHFLSNYIDTYCFCLLPNHFHLLVRIKPCDAIIQQARKDFSAVGKYATMPAEQWVSERFRLLFLSYTKAINKQISRKGSLFQRPFKRKKVDNDSYFNSLVWYIQRNPEHHGIHHDFTTYSWSSFQRILSEKPSKLMKKEVLDWFGGKENYVVFHQQNAINERGFASLLLE